MNKIIASLILSLSLMTASYAQTGNQFSTHTAGQSVIGVVSMCLDSGGLAVPTNQSGNCPGGGGSSGAVFGPTAVGSAGVQPPVTIGGTADGTQTGTISAWKIVSGVGFINCANCSGSGISVGFGGAIGVVGTPGGFKDGSGNFQPLLGDVTNGQWVNIKSSISLPVTGTFFQATQPISATSLPLPAGAATQTTLASILSALGSPFQTGGNIGNTSFGATQATASALNATVVGTGTFAVQATLQPSAATAIGKVDPNTIGAWGLQVSTQNSVTPTNGQLALGQFNTSPTAITSGNVSPFQLDVNGNLKVNVAVGGGTGGTSSSFGAAFPGTGTAIGMTQGGNMVALSGTSGNLNVQCANCSGSGASAVDEAAMTFGTSVFAPMGGVFQTTATNNPLTSGQHGMAQLTINRAVHMNLRNSTGVEIGNSTTPIQVSLANTAANATALLVTGTGGTFPITAASLPLPAGASTSALQPTNAAIASTTSGQTGHLMMGAVTAGAPTYTTAQTNPLSLTTAGALRIDGSAATQPVSNAGTFAVQLTGATNNINNISGTISLPTGAGTSANQTSILNALSVNTLTSAHTCSVAGFSVASCLGQMDDDIKGPLPLLVNGSATSATALTPGVAQTGTIVAANQDLTSLHGTALGAPSNFGTTPGAVIVPGVNASLFVGTAVNASGNPLFAQLTASSVVVGKVGIDQTTPGTTNGVTQTDGTNTALVDACQSGTKVYTPVNVVTATNIIIPGVAAKKKYICGMFLYPGGTDNIAIYQATTGTSCATAAVGVIGGATTATGIIATAQAGFILPTTGYAHAATTVNQTDLCITTSAAVQLSGVIVTVDR